MERPNNIKESSSNSPRIQHFGPNVRAHKRHFLQQSEYTICAHYNNEWHFDQHEAVFSRDNPNQDLIWRFDIPISERNKVIAILDSYNINAFSLYGSEEALMQTLAMRKLL
jgi:hypothetical protein